MYESCCSKGCLLSFYLELEDIASTLQQFYAGLVIFITGRSGFLGKPLLLKLYSRAQILGA